MRTKNVVQNDNDDLRPEYDFSQLKGSVRGKYFKRATAGTTLVLLEADVAAAIPDREERKSSTAGACTDRTGSN